MRKMYNTYNIFVKEQFYFRFPFVAQGCCSVGSAVQSHSNGEKKAVMTCLRLSVSDLQRIKLGLSYLDLG